MAAPGAVPWEKAPWLVGIRRDASRAPVGAGALVTDRHILTCAHVVARSAERPTDPVYVGFPHLGAHKPIAATVVEGGWHPKDPATRSGDLALLELAKAPPEGASPAPLVSTRTNLLGHAFHVYGYPEGPHKRDGVSARGEFAGSAGPDWIQLEARSALGHALAPGFSGSPVWDVELGGVVGIAATRDAPDETGDPRTGYAIRTDTAAQLLPQLAELLRAPLTASQRERLEALLALPLRPDGELPTVREVRVYDIGVSPSKNLEHDPDPPYAPRRQADSRLAQALEHDRFIVLTGHSKAGKSRTMVEALRRELPDGTRIIVPRDMPSAPGELARLPLPTGADRAVLWLDDLEDYLKPGGLDIKVLTAFERMDPPVTVVATLTSANHDMLTGQRTAGPVLGRARQIRLPRKLADEDIAEASELYRDEDFTERGIGELMVAAPLMESRLAAAPEQSPEGWAVVRAAVDWARMGGAAPLTRARLRDLFTPYHQAGRPNRAASDEGFEAGLRWATTVVAGTLAPVSEAARDGELHYTAFGYLPGYFDASEDPEMRAVAGFAWEHALRGAPADDQLGIAFAALLRDEIVIAVEGFAEVRDTAEDPPVAAWATLFLAGAAAAVDDLAEAERLYTEVVATGLPDLVPLARIDLAGVLVKLGHPEAAQQMLETAVESDNPHVAALAHASLGSLLLGLGRPDAAREHLTAALQSDDPHSVALARTSLAGDLLNRQGDTPGRRPTQRTGSEPLEGKVVGVPQHLTHAVGEAVFGHAVPLATLGLAMAAVDSGDLAEAEDLLQSVMASENPLVAPQAQAFVGLLLIERGESDEARAVLLEVTESGNTEATQQAWIALGLLHGFEGEYEQAKEILGHALEFPHAEAVLHARYRLGHVRALEGDFAGAAAEFQVLVDSGHPGWRWAALVDLGACRSQLGDFDGAREALSQAAESGHPDQAPRAADLLGDLLAAYGEHEAAEHAYRRASATDHPVWSRVARIDLAVMLADIGDVAAARDILAPETRPGEPYAAIATAVLGVVHLYDGDAASARRLLGAAKSSDVPHAADVATLHLAKLDEEQGRFAEARAGFEAVLGSRTATASELELTAAAHLGALLLRGGDRVAALTLLGGTEAVDDPEAAAEALLGAGAHLLEIGDVAVARRYPAAVLAMDVPDFRAPARALLGIALLSDRDLEAARRELTAAAAAVDDELLPMVLRYLGSALAQLGRNDEARDALLRLAESDDDEHRPEGLVLLGRLAMLAGRPEEAHTWFAAAAEAGGPSLATRIARESAEAAHALGPTSPRPALTATDPPTAAPEAPPAQEHTPDVPLPEPTAPPPVLPVLSAGLLTLLGRLADAEGELAEAQWWFDRAAAQRDEHRPTNP